MTTIDIDGLSEEDFRRSIESRLRQGLAAKAVEKLRTQLAPFAGPDGILPERFLTVSADDLTLGGWDALSDAMRRHDRPGRPITALSIAFGWPGEDVPQPDAEGRLSPLIETGFYTDDAFPFSQSSREDLLEGYSYHGCTWTGDCEATDTALWLTGIDDLHGALAELETRLLASEEPDEAGIRAGSLGACLLSALLFQAVDTRIAQGGLPRPLCVMAGSSGVYPYFDAPVAGYPEEARKAAELADEVSAVDAGVPGPRYSSLLVTGIPRAKKRAVLVLAETADEEAMRIARLRGLAHAAPASAEEIPEPPAPLRSDGSIAAAPDSPLLAKKPSGQSWDFREMLSSFEPEADPDGTESSESDLDWDEAAPLAPEQDWGEPERGEPEPQLGEPESFELEPESDANELLEPAPYEPEQDWGAAVSPEPVEEPLPTLYGVGNVAPVGPGFSLLDALREDRQQPLFPLPDFHAVEEEELEPDQTQVEAALEQPEAPAAETTGPVDAFAPYASAAEAALDEPELDAPVAAEPAPPAWPPDSAWLSEFEARILPKASNIEPAVPQLAPAEEPAAKSLWTRLGDWWNGRR